MEIERLLHVYTDMSERVRRIREILEGLLEAVKVIEEIIERRRSGLLFALEAQKPAVVPAVEPVAASGEAEEIIAGAASDAVEEAPLTSESTAGPEEEDREWIQI